MDEFRFIESLLAPLSKGEIGALSLKDDAAILNVPEGLELVITKDALIEGVHFIGDEEASLIARKAVAVNLSDLAAMGAEPRYYFLALMLPAKRDESWLSGFAEGLRTAQAEYGITLMGGDTTRTSGPLSLSITALGFVTQGHALLRSGAKSGDGIYVSGTLGDAALGLSIAKKESDKNDFLLSRYQLPSPRIKLGQALRAVATACMDISDGLLQDLGHICKSSGVGAEIEWEHVPLSPEARARLAAMPAVHSVVLAGGDDYELLFTAPPEAAPQLEEAARSASILVTRIGHTTAGSGIKVRDAEGKEVVVARTGYTHF